MGYRAPLDYNAITHNLWVASTEMNSPYNDGYVTFEIKKDLYKIKFLLDDILKNGPHYVGEEEFLKEMEQQKIMDILKR